MNVSLTPELEAIIREKVDSGLYHSASEVVREALRLLRQHDEARQARLAELRKELAVGLQQADRGEVRALNMGEIKRKARSHRGR